MLRRMRRLAALLAAALLVSAGPLSAQETSRQELVPRLAGAELVAALAQGGHVILVRHMATDRTPDKLSGVDLADCTTQRNLSEEGRRQAVDLGRAFQKLSIPVGDVLVSPYCRCIETGKLAFGKGEPSDVLSIWDELSLEEKTERGVEIRKLLDTEPQPGSNTVLVTHTGNLLWSFGLDSRPEGLAHVFKPTGLSLGRASYVGKIAPEEWRALAALDAEPPQPSPPHEASTP
jgi:phosphohistidine phosphatase SixA